MTRLERRIEAAKDHLEDAIMFTFGKATAIKKAMKILTPLVKLAQEQEPKEEINGHE